MADPRAETGARQRAGRGGKSASAFRTISEVADELDVAQHVLRFWESKFPQVRPLKRGGGRRYYRPEDVDLLRQIRSLLYEEGYTIKGAQKLLKGQRRPAPDGATDDGQASLDVGSMAAEGGEPAGEVAGRDGSGSDRERLHALRDELVRARDQLRRLLA